MIKDADTIHLWVDEDAESYVQIMKNYRREIR